MHGYDMYDSSARMYDPLTVRTPTPDPHCENYYSISPYAWLGNNFVNRIDPDGRDYWSTNDQGEITAFLNLWGNDGKQFDFSNSNWSHFRDIESLSRSTPAALTYDDEKKVFYLSYAETNADGITVIGKSYEADITPVSFDGLGYEGAFVYEPRKGFDEHLFYYRELSILIDSILGMLIPKDV